MNWESIRATVLDETDRCVSSSWPHSPNSDVKISSSIHHGDISTSESDHLRAGDAHRDLRVASLEREVHDLRDMLRALFRQTDSQVLSWNSERDQMNEVMNRVMDRTEQIEQRQVDADAVLRKISKDAADLIDQVDVISRTQEHTRVEDESQREIIQTLRRDQGKFMDDMERLRTQYTSFCTSSEVTRIVRASMKEGEAHIHGEINGISLRLENIASQSNAVSNQLNGLQRETLLTDKKLNSICTAFEMDGTSEGIRADENEASSCNLGTPWRLPSFAHKQSLQHVEEKVGDLERAIQMGLTRAVDQFDERIAKVMRHVESFERRKDSESAQANALQAVFENRHEEVRRNIHLLESELKEVRDASHASIKAIQLTQAETNSNFQDLDRRLKQNEARASQDALVQEARDSSALHTEMAKIIEAKIAGISRSVDALETDQRDQRDAILGREREFRTTLAEADSRITSIEMFVKHARGELDRSSVSLESIRTEIVMMSKTIRELSDAIHKLETELKATASREKVESMMKSIASQVAVVQNEAELFKRALEHLTESTSDMSKTATFLNKKQDSLGRDVDGIEVRTNDLADAVDLLAQRLQTLKGTVVEHDTEIANSRLQTHSSSNTSFLELQAQQVAMLNEVADQLKSTNFFRGMLEGSSLHEEAPPPPKRNEAISTLQTRIVNVESSENDLETAEKEGGGAGLPTTPAEMEPTDPTEVSGQNSEDFASSAKRRTLHNESEAPMIGAISQKGGGSFSSSLTASSSLKEAEVPNEPLPHAPISPAATDPELKLVSPRAASSGSSLADESSYRRWEQQLEEEAKRREALVYLELSAMTATEDLPNAKVTDIRIVESAKQNEKDHVTVDVDEAPETSGAEIAAEDISLEGSVEVGGECDLVIHAHREREGPLPGGQDAIFLFRGNP